MSVAKEFPVSRFSPLIIFGPLLLFATLFYSQESKVLGEVEFVAAAQVEKHSGIWVDGQYVGYLEELKGSNKVLLLPGEHQIAARQCGYRDFTQKILVEPGQKQTIRVSLTKDPRAQLPRATAEVKLEVTPSRAAVFMDDSFVGPVHDFGGMGRALLISPGKHRIKIALPGYQAFETEINLQPNQKFTVKTGLVKGSIAQAGALIKEP